MCSFLEIKLYSTKKMKMAYGKRSLLEATNRNYQSKWPSGMTKTMVGVGESSYLECTSVKS